MKRSPLAGCEQIGTLMLVCPTADDTVTERIAIECLKLSIKSPRLRGERTIALQSQSPALPPLPPPSQSPSSQNRRRISHLQNSPPPARPDVRCRRPCGCWDQVLSRPAAAVRIALPYARRRPC